MIARLASKKLKTGIRPLNPAHDLGPLADLIENAFGQELAAGGERILREIRLLSKLGSLNYLFMEAGSDVESIFSGFVWEQDGRLVGNVTVNRPTAYSERWQISNVAVLDSYRRQGIGRQLVEAAINMVSSHGGRTAYLFVRDDNEPAVRLYRRLGFQELDRRTELEWRPQAHPAQPDAIEHLQPLQARQEPALYDLVRRAEGTGYHWLYSIRREQYVWSGTERLARRFRSMLTGEIELRWAVSGLWELCAAMILRVEPRWSARPQYMQLWVDPSWRGQVETDLSRDVVSILYRHARPRPVSVSLAADEGQVAAALMAQGFQSIRTLVLMKMDL